MARPLQNFSHHHRSAITLVEVMFSVAIMTTMLAASLGAAGGAARTRIAQKDSAIGLSLARQLMSEILQTRYADLQNPSFGVESGETRATFDDVDDYLLRSENSAVYADGTTIPGGKDFRRSVLVTYVSTSNPNSLAFSDTGLKRITVTVRSPSGRVTTLSALRSSSDGYENTPGSQVTYTSWVGVMVQVGNSDTARSEQGVNLLNQIP